MKRYVREIADDCIEMLKRFETATLKMAAPLHADKEKKIKDEYSYKYKRINEIVEQCEYGYFTDLKAVELILDI